MTTEGVAQGDLGDLLERWRIRDARYRLSKSRRSQADVEYVFAVRSVEAVLLPHADARADAATVLAAAYRDAFGMRIDVRAVA